MEEFLRFPGSARRAAASLRPCARQLVPPWAVLGLAALLRSAERFLVGRWAAGLSPVRCHRELRVGESTMTVPRMCISVAKAAVCDLQRFSP